MVITALSGLLLTAAGVLAVLAVVLFFSLNIPKCLRMVSGRRRDTIRKTQAHRSGQTRILETGEETVLLAQDTVFMREAYAKKEQRL
ncbi:MAG: hypothetical protein K2L86_00030 [Lachnospiraceae bacterium]|nr:hypothetical protein [Lachnospiraceae bacterium]